MKDKKLLTPAGFHDYLELEFAYKKEVETTISNMFSQYGYRRLTSPMLEFLEVFEIGSVNTKDIFKFMNKDGEVLALRSDMTPPIARIVANNFDHSKIPYRFCYIENSFRATRDYQGKESEFTQAGVEFIGINSIESDCEIIALAIESIIATGLKEFKVDLGNVGFLRGILEEVNISQEKCLQLEKFIIKGDFVAVEKLVLEENIAEPSKDILSNLSLLSGNLDLLKEARQKTKNKKALDALEELEKVYNMLKDYGVEQFVQFDLSMIGQLNYYSGLIFHGYSKGVGYSILDGGRYDNLIEKFGANLPAVGFAIKINELLTALVKQNDLIFDRTHHTLVMYQENSRKIAIETAKEIRKNLVVEISMFGDDLEKNKKYAHDNKLGGILYFKNGEEVEIININTGESSTTSIAEILKGGE